MSPNIDRVERKELRSLRGAPPPKGSAKAGQSTGTGPQKRVDHDRVTISDEAREALRRDADEEEPEEEGEGEDEPTTR